MRMMKTDKYLARSVGISYALGILLQFANNNLVRSDTVQAVVLSVFLLLLVLLLIKMNGISANRTKRKPMLRKRMKRITKMKS